LSELLSEHRDNPPGERFYAFQMDLGPVTLKLVVACVWHAERCTPPTRFLSEVDRFDTIAPVNKETLLSRRTMITLYHRQT